MALSCHSRISLWSFIYVCYELLKLIEIVKFIPVIEGTNLLSRPQPIDGFEGSMFCVMCEGLSHEAPRNQLLDFPCVIVTKAILLELGISTLIHSANVYWDSTRNWATSSAEDKNVPVLRNTLV